jgi:hypothetical protein
MKELFRKMKELHDMGFDVTINAVHNRWSSFPFSLMVYNSKNSRSTSRLFDMNDVDSLLEGIDQLIKEIEE